MSAFPLLTRAGLKVIETLYYGERQWIEAADVERWLEQAPVVYGLHAGADTVWTMDKTGMDTHMAKILLIEPIARDTAEGLLRELVDAIAPTADGPSLARLRERARKMLEGK
jgi:hypothetical protein